MQDNKVNDENKDAKLLKLIKDSKELYSDVSIYTNYKNFVGWACVFEFITYMLTLVYILHTSTNDTDLMRPDVIYLVLIYIIMAFVLNVGLDLVLAFKHRAWKRKAIELSKTITDMQLDSHNLDIFYGVYVLSK